MAEFNLFQWGPAGRGVYVDASGSLQINTTPNASGYIVGYGEHGHPLLVDASGRLLAKDSATTALDDLSDVDTSGYATGESIVWDGSQWAPSGVTASGASTTLNALTDTTIATPASGQALEYNGSVWVNKGEVFTTLSTDTTLNQSTHKFIKVDTSGGDVTLTLPLSADGLHAYDIWKTTSDTNDVIIARAGADTIIGSTTFTFNTQWAHYELIADTGTAWLVK
jgi:hypothetical protein